MSMIPNELYVSMSRVRSYGPDFGLSWPFCYFSNVTPSLMFGRRSAATEIFFRTYRALTHTAKSSSPLCGFR